MNARIFWTAFALGLAAVTWVAFGFAGSNWTAFAMSLVIGGTFLAGALELRRHRADTAGLAAAVADLAAEPASLDGWLDRVPAALRPSVRLRVESERGALPGPALTPYLTGLLVMLGMLGTFLGMVVTFKGAVFALEGSTDLQAIRAALAEPIRGLGLSFGTSVAGVAASALLGLMSSVARRERLDVARLLEGRIATVLRPFTLARQREDVARAVQAQSAALPGVVGQLEAMMERIERRNRELDERLLASQAQFHRDAAAAYTGLAQTVGASLKDSLAAGAKAAGESIRPVMEDAMTRIAQDTRQLHERLGEAANAQVDALTRQFGDTARGVGEHWQATLDAQAQGDAQRLAAWTRSLESIADGVEAQLKRTGEHAGAQAQRALEDASRLLAQSEALVQSRMDTESHWLAQHGDRMDALAATWRDEMQALRADEAKRGDAAVARLGELQAAVAQHLATLGAALEAPLARLLATASEVPQAAAGVLAQLRAEMSRLAEQENAALQERTVLVERLGALVDTVEEASSRAAVMAAQAGANAIELSSWGEAFGRGVEVFQASNEKMAAGLQQLEAAVSRSTARSDEQLAYYVAQAREVIDLSIASQHGVIERLRELAGKPAGIAVKDARA